MRKKLYIILLALLCGAGVGYYRSVVMERYYDPMSKTIASEAGTAIFVMTALSVALLALLAWLSFRVVKGRAFDRTQVSKHIFPYALCSAILSLFVAYAAIRTPGATTYDFIFAAAVLFGAGASLLVSKASGELQRLMSLCPVLPLILSVLHIYKDNIKYPNISNFIMEVLATLSLMLAAYYAFSIFFKKVRPASFMVTLSCSVFFSFVCIVSNWMMRTGAVTPTIPPYFSIYFVAVIIYLFGFITLLVSPDKLPHDNLTYYGWSAFTLESKGAVLGFDNYCRKLANVQYVSFDDVPASDCILLSHNHPDHCLDIAAFVERDSCPLVAPKQYLDHNPAMAEKATVAGDFTDFDINGFDITTFQWPHREMGSVPKAEDEADFDYSQEIECYGQIVKLPSGSVVVNLAEGANPRMTKDILKKVYQVAGQVDYLLMGYQLDFIKECVLCCDMLLPKTIVLFHPHEALFESQNIATQPVKDFVKAIKKSLPDSEVIVMNPVETAKLYY